MLEPGDGERKSHGGKEGVVIGNLVGDPRKKVKGRSEN
jgi:hypothetical protein